MAEKLYQDEAWLREQYLKNELSMHQIAELASCGYVTINTYINRFKIPVRSLSDAIHKRCESRPLKAQYQDEAWLRYQYLDLGKDGQEIADMFGCSSETICVYLRKYNIPRKTPSDIRKGKHCSREVKEKLRIANIGKHPSEESRKKMSASRTGKNHWNYGKHWNDATLAKMSASKKGEKSANWKGGISYEPYCPKFNRHVKEEIRERFERTCFLCPKREEENKYKLAIHHIDYNKNTLCNGKTWPLVALCLRCHSKTNFNRWYWFNLLINYWAFNQDIIFDPPILWNPCMATNGHFSSVMVRTD